MQIRALFSGILLAATAVVVASVSASAASPESSKSASGGHGLLLPLIDSAAERVQVADKVAAAKFPDQPITDPVREQQVLDDATRQAARLGINSDSAIGFFRDQIEAAKVVEYGLFARWTAHPEEAPKTRPDLPGEVRPVIDRINAQLLSELADTTSTRASHDCEYRLPVAVRVTGALRRLDPLHQEALDRAVLSVCG